jgi:hypothetical protein
MKIDRESLFEDIDSETPRKRLLRIRRIGPVKRTRKERDLGTFQKRRGETPEENGAEIA